MCNFIEFIIKMSAIELKRYYLQRVLEICLFVCLFGHALKNSIINIYLVSTTHQLPKHLLNISASDAKNPRINKL